MPEEEETSIKASKEGTNLLGSPTFTQIQKRRSKCVETGHEILSRDKEMYSQSKRCRIGLIDFALANNKPPLNMFKPDPSNRSKLICKLTGDTVNKSEVHIWKHINGKRFLHKLEQMELGNGEEKQQQEEQKSVDNGEKKKKDKKKKKRKDKKKKTVKEIVSEVRDPSDKDSDAEDVDFWMPPAGQRWDFDDGGDRWGSDDELEQKTEEENGADDVVLENGESEELLKRTKRMSIEIGPSSFASRKKKSKKNPAN